MNKPNDNNIICVYFCEKHLEKEKGEITLETNNNDIELEPIKDIIEVKGNKKYKYTIFCIKINKNNNNEMKIKIKYEDKNNKKKFKSYIELEKENLSGDIFIYNFKLTSKSLLLFEKELERFEYTNMEQFEIYLNNIIKLNNNKKDLIISTKKLFLNKNYSFSFYITVFYECLEINDIDCLKDYLYLFDPEKIDKIEISTDKNSKIHEIWEKLKNYGNNPDNILNDDINDKKKEEITAKLYALIIILIKIIAKEEISEYLDIEKNYIKEYISKALIKYKHFFHKCIIKLEYQIILKVIENIRFFELNDFLKYCKSVSDILKILCDDKFSKFLQKYRYDQNEHTIDIGKIVKPQINDNLKEISDLYSKFKGNRDSNKIYLRFNSSLLEYYMDCFKNKNIDNLYYIKNIIDRSYSYLKEDINRIIYETGIFLAEKKSLNNEQILKIIQLTINSYL